MPGRIAKAARTRRPPPRRAHQAASLARKKANQDANVWQDRSLPLDDERSDIIVFNQRFAKNLWKTTVVDSGNIVP